MGGGAHLTWAFITLGYSVKVLFVLLYFLYIFFIDKADAVDKCGCI